MHMHIGQPVVAAAVAEGEAFVVEAELVQDRGMQVVDGQWIEDGVRAELVGLAIGDATFEAATRHKRSCSRSHGGRDQSRH